MKFYDLKLEKPAWFFDPPTNRQLKVLKFFNQDSAPNLTKGKASGMVGRIFSDGENKDLWEKYVFLTGDGSRETPDLVEFDWDELRAVVIPDDWYPKYTPGISSKRKTRLRTLVVEMLKEGSPYDDPVPEIKLEGSNFAFTEKFTTGTREECQVEVGGRGGIGQKSVNLSTDFLVIGNEGSENWAEGTHGRKIEKALILRMENGKPAVISESDWIAALQRNG